MLFKKNTVIFQHNAERKLQLNLLFLMRSEKLKIQNYGLSE